MIIIVRHGHAGDKHKWRGPDHHRPLSDTGRRESHGLLTRLGGLPIAAVRSSPALRCVQTVAELAQVRGVPLRLDTRLSPDADIADLLALVYTGEDLLLCTHGEVIAELFDALRDRHAPIGAFAEWPKGSTWLLDVANGTVRSASYLPPLSAAVPDPPDPPNPPLGSPIPGQRAVASIGNAAP